MARKRLFTGGTVVQTAHRIRPVDLLVEGTRIVALPERDTPIEGDVERIDVAGRVVIPGFVQAHVHLCQTLLRNMADDLPLLEWLTRRIWPGEGAHTGESLHLSALLGIHELLAGGTTTILDMATVHHTDAVFAAVERTGIRAMVGKCLMDAASVPAPLRQPTDRALRESSDLCGRWDGAAGGRIRYAYAPRFALSCTPELLRQVGELARQQRVRIHTHASESREEVRRVRQASGLGNLALLAELGLLGPDVTLAHCVQVDEQAITRLAASGTRVAHCPSSNLKLGSGIAPVPAMLEAGVPVGLGADGAPCNNNLSMFIEMRLASLIQKPLHGATAMDAPTVFDLATRGGARALGLEADIGTLEPGKQADLVCLDLQQVHSEADHADDLLSAIVYAADPRNVVFTVVAGDFVYRDGQVRGIEVAPTLREARRWRQRMREVMR